MLQIAICDDVVEQTASLQEYVRDYFKRESVEYSLHIYTDGMELAREAGRLDIVFLDIGMPGADGIEAGRAIRRAGGSCRIIMATCMEGRMKEAFSIEAFRFITKPFHRGEVEEALDACMRKRLGCGRIRLYRGRNSYEVRQSEIQCIASYDSYCEYWVKDEVLRNEASLREMEDRLDSRLFFRVSRKYIVNMAKIQEYRDGSILLRGERLPVSRRRKKEFERAYMTFDLEYR